MAGKNGGARPGAGRKPKAEQYKLPIRKAEKRIADRLPSIVDKMLELSEGVLVKNPGLSESMGMTIVYEKAPDRQACEYLLNRIMGKPTEAVEISGPDKGAIPMDISVMLDRVYGDDSGDASSAS